MLCHARKAWHSRPRCTATASQNVCRRTAVWPRQLHVSRAVTAAGEHAGEVTSRPNEPVLRNAAGVQLLSPSLHRQVFGDKPSPPLDATAVKIAREHLERNKLAQTESKALPLTEFTLPRLQGSDIEEHFYNLGLAYSAPYLDLAKEYSKADLPPRPDTWAKASGWIRYNRDGSYEPVDHPPDEAMTFDVETLYKIQPFAVMATAASAKNWYAWTSPWLLGESDDSQHLIPLPTSKPRLVIGHNVGYDRARIEQEYHLERSQNRFMDTMSLHVAVTGLSSHQRAPWMKYKKLKQAKLQAAAEAASGSSTTASASEKAAASTPRWEDLSSMSSLEHVAKLHCGIDVDKSARDYFSATDKQEILDHFQELMAYCAKDVAVTHKVFKAVLAAFLVSCPNPVTFAGVLSMGNSFLPVDKAWQEFVQRAEGLYESLTAKVEQELHKLAEQARLMMFKRDAKGRLEYEKDPWLSQLDWTPKKAREVILSSTAEDGGNNETSTYSPQVVPEERLENEEVQKEPTEEEAEPSEEENTSEIPADDVEPAAGTAPAVAIQGQPQWLKSLTKSLQADSLTQKAVEQVVPLLLKASMHGYPMRWSSKDGWMYVVPSGSAAPSAYAQKVSPNPFESEGTTYQPHKIPARSLLSAKFKKPLEDGILTFHSPLGVQAVEVGLSQTKNKTVSPEMKALEKQIVEYAKSLAGSSAKTRAEDPWLRQLDCTGSIAVQEVGETISQTTSNPAGSDDHSLTASKAEQPASTEPVKGRRRRSSLFPDRDISPAGQSSPALHVVQQAVPPKLSQSPRITFSEALDQSTYMWPKWFWDMTRPRPGQTGLNLTIRSKAAPILLRLRWRNRPIYFSRQHGWLYRIPKSEIEDLEEKDESGQVPTIGGSKPAKIPEKKRKAKSEKSEASSAKDCPTSDLYLHDDLDHYYYKLPHKDGGDANVGTPLAKTFIPAFEDGTLSSEFAAARAALEMNAQCSYWISARERVLNQLVVWRNGHNDQGFPTSKPEDPYGMILPQVITMGTVTRRAVESTWLAASNAKKNRLGSELKAMVRAPPGYAIVGADVDSEELWICSVLGDAQFGFHGATAIGWMTLEGTKSAGTDLHSKTASIMGISRDQAKVFNYSRLYGAGVKHAVQLLLQGNPQLSKEEATQLAKQLYAATKGSRVHSARAPFNRKMWYGGTESHVFNKLEDVATASDPRTPALGCGITSALAKKNLPATELSKAGEDFMPSRINWVVQSSGVDYLHLLIVSMEYLIRRFDISARFMISVHDEIRYLVTEQDRHRAALALQISNIWTRALFSHRLQMESLPQSCAWFSAVDLDHVLRKEVNMDCVTPSQPVLIKHGVSQTITDTLAETSSGSLFADGRDMSHESSLPQFKLPPGYSAWTPSGTTYRSKDISFLQAQNAASDKQLKDIEREVESGHHDWELASSSARPVKGNTSISRPVVPVTRAQPIKRPTRASKVASPVTTLPLRRAPDVSYRH